MKLLIAVMCAFVAASASGQQVGLPASPEHVMRYLTLIGINQTLQSLTDQMIAEQQRGFAALRPDIPSAVWDDIRADLRNGIDARPLLNGLVAIYQQHFSDAEMTQIVAFYETPVGKKLAGAQMPLNAESYIAEFQWRGNTGNLIGERIVTLAKARGYDFDQPPPKKKSLGAKLK